MPRNSDNTPIPTTTPTPGQRFETIRDYLGELRNPQTLKSPARMQLVLLTIESQARELYRQAR